MTDLIIIAVLVLIESIIVGYFSYQAGHIDGRRHLDSIQADAYQQGYNAGKHKGLAEGAEKGRRLGYEDGMRYARAQEFNSRVLVADGILTEEEALKQDRKVQLATSTNSKKKRSNKPTGKPSNKPTSNP